MKEADNMYVVKTKIDNKSIEQKTLAYDQGSWLYKRRLIQTNK